MTPSRMLFVLVPTLLLVLAGCGNYRRVEEPAPARSITQPVNESTPPSVIPRRPPRQNVPFRRSQRGSHVPQDSSQLINYAADSQGIYVNEPVQEVQVEEPHELSHHETKFDLAETNRNTNIALAAQAINGQIVDPGEIFSYNDTLGSTTRDRGYKKGTIFVNGKKAEGYGGGVCQVSSTLYNAAVNAGMTIIERHEHPQPVSYVERGKDAATSHNGGLDFRFQNNKSFPVVIHATVESGTVSVTISEV